MATLSLEDQHYQQRANTSRPRVQSSDDSSLANDMEWLGSATEITRPSSSDLDQGGRVRKRRSSSNASLASQITDVSTSRREFLRASVDLMSRDLRTNANNATGGQFLQNLFGFDQSSPSTQPEGTLFMPRDDDDLDDGPEETDCIPPKEQSKQIHDAYGVWSPFVDSG